MTFYRPTWAEISTKAFASNLRALKAFVGRHVQLLAVLKADAYGHGADALCRVAVKNGASAIGVSSLEEGIALRRIDKKIPLLLLGSIFPLENFSVALQYDLIPSVSSWQAFEILRKAGGGSQKRWSFHLKVDTGMGRIGLSTDAARRMLEHFTSVEGARLSGVYSHLSCADSDEPFTRQQLNKFVQLKTFVQGWGFRKVLFHTANSAAIFNHKQSHHDMVRPGLALYGVSMVSLPKGISLKPVLRWLTRIVFLKQVPFGTPISYGKTFVTKKESTIATLPVGYADGVPRRLSNKGFVLVRGKRCPIVGLVTMDQIMVDVTGHSVNVGDEVVLIGQQGNETLTVEEWAAWADTIPYEIFCGISKRVPRVVV